MRCGAWSVPQRQLEPGHGGGSLDTAPRPRVPSGGQWGTEHNNYFTLN